MWDRIKLEAGAVWRELCVVTLCVLFAAHDYQTLCGRRWCRRCHTSKEN